MYKDVLKDIITEMFETPKNCIFEALKNNSFSENMIKLVNEFSKDNYTCRHYHGLNHESLKCDILSTVRGPPTTLIW